MLIKRCKKPRFLDDTIAKTAFNIAYYCFLAALILSNIGAQSFNFFVNEKKEIKNYFDYAFWSALPAVGLIIIMFARAILRKFAKSKYTIFRWLGCLIIFFGLYLRSQRKLIAPAISYQNAGITRVIPHI